MARRYMHGKRRRKRSPLNDKSLDIKGLKYSPETSKVTTGIFTEGGGTSGDTRKIVIGGKLGYKTKVGDFSLRPGFISEKGKYHSINKGDLKVGYTANFDQIKKLFGK